MNRRRWAAYIGAGAALDIWCAYGNGGTTLSTCVRERVPNHPAAETLFIGVLFLGAAWFAGHILDEAKRAIS